MNDRFLLRELRWPLRPQSILNIRSSCYGRSVGPAAALPTAPAAPCLVLIGAAGAEAAGEDYRGRAVKQLEGPPVRWSICSRFVLASNDATSINAALRYAEAELWVTMPGEGCSPPTLCLLLLMQPTGFILCMLTSGGIVAGMTWLLADFFDDNGSPS
ncbi:hypothetical protein QJQ45_012031 [Haematococcus lacustris]|nr:hypothetical protein QJQ45_012031 [Haematococcus lacustris]